MPMLLPCSPTGLRHDTCCGREKNASAATENVQECLDVRALSFKQPTAFSRRLLFSLSRLRERVARTFQSEPGEGSCSPWHRARGQTDPSPASRLRRSIRWNFKQPTAFPRALAPRGLRYFPLQDVRGGGA